MDSVEVAVRLTEAIMSNSSSRVKGTDPAEVYTDMFAQVLKRLNVIMAPALPPHRQSQANSTVFPLSHDR
ncbi:MAG: hypothetical protein BZY75_01095 [SAR202 cluster bacterium Io17-Chloro-G7]|nr:MAG: hypothetical protein BZY75_01095 [SAR202 cluster bacterium Io17-Chloro-G7]